MRTYLLRDRLRGDVSISGNSVLVVTDSSLGGHGGASTIEVPEEDADRGPFALATVWEVRSVS